MSAFSSLRNRTSVIAASSAMVIGASLVLVPATTASAAVGDPGTLDTAFATPAMSNAVTSIAMQPDGKMIIVGGFENVGPNHSSYVARLNGDGSIDASFNPPTFTSGSPRTAAVLPSGDIVVAGGFTQKIVNGVSSGAPKITRLNSTGGVYAGGSASFPTGEITALAVDSVNYGVNTRVLAGGDFTGAAILPNGSTANGFVSLLYGQSPDTNTMGLGGGGTNYVRSIAVQPDGKYVIGGHFFRGSEQGITRTLSESSDDATFNPPAVSGLVSSIALAPDGKIYIAGFFSYTGAPSTYVARLNADGSNDPTFVPPTLDDQAHAVAVLPNGKVVVAGEFTSANGNTTYAKLARLNTNGSLDTTFVPPAFNNNLYALGKTSDSKLIVGGFFTDLGGNASIDRIARVFSGELAPAKTAQKANGTVKKLKVGKKKKLPKVTKQGVPEKWTSLTKSKCKIKSGKLVAVKKGTCKLRVTAPTTAAYLGLKVTIKVKIVK